MVACYWQQVVHFAAGSNFYWGGTAVGFSLVLCKSHTTKMVHSCLLGGDPRCGVMLGLIEPAASGFLPVRRRPAATGIPAVYPWRCTRVHVVLEFLVGHKRFAVGSVAAGYVASLCLPFATSLVNQCGILTWLVGLGSRVLMSHERSALLPYTYIVCSRWQPMGVTGHIAWF